MSYFHLTLTDLIKIETYLELRYGKNSIEVATVHGVPEADHAEHGHD